MARASIRSRLTIVISGLILAAGLVFSTVAYMEVRRALERAGGDRLHAVATELANLLTQSVTAGIDQTRDLAAKPDLRAALRAAGDGPVAVPASMAAYVKANKGSSAWLLRPDGSVVVAEPADAKLAHVPHSPDEAVGPLVPVGDAIGFTLTAPLGGVGGEAPPDGFVVVRRISSGSGGAAIERLIGAGTNFKIGNADGSVWTDLSKAVDAPRAQVGSGTIRFVDAAGEARLGTAVSISATPWVVWLAMPRATLLQPTQTLLNRMIPIGLVLIALGAIAAGVVSARVTRPVERLAAAADDIAAGQYSRRADVEGPDEIARLGVAFNTMASQVERSHRDLEQRVEDRTRDLAQAMAQLTDAQEELVRKERLATLGQLASGVGHELRNPLGVMTNAIYYLEMVQPDAPEDVREYLGILRHQIGLSEKIVTDLLDFARIKPPQVQTISPASFIENQIARLGAVDELMIDRRVPPDLPSIAIDPVQIGQVLLNLLTNAVQAMEGGGVITVSARAEGETVKIEVSDTGPGIPDELRGRIFDPLFTTKPRGIGLGLSVSRSLAEANGGRLDLVGGDGGAVFALTLPAVTAAAQEAGC